MRSATSTSTTSDSGQASGQAAPGFLHVAKELLVGTSAAALIGRIPATLRQAGAGIKGLSTTQKVVGGALLAKSLYDRRRIRAAKTLKK